MTLSHRFHLYWKETPTLAVLVDVLRLLAILASPFLALLLLRWTATTDLFLAPLHRRFWANPHYVTAGFLYRGFLTSALALNAAWVLRALRNFITITASRSLSAENCAHDDQKLDLPPWPYNRESFAVILGELQDRDGARVPNADSPNLKPRWLILPKLSLYTGVFVTGGIGSGKTSAVAYPALRQILGFRRHVPIRRKDGGTDQAPWTFSGLIMDEKGDFTRAATQYAEEWGRADDIIRISPGGKWIWNVIYNPNLPTWAVAYQLGWILKNFNKSASSGDPFWENAPKELVTDYLGLLDDAKGYYTLFDYLETLVDDIQQNSLHEQAMQRYAKDPPKVEEIERRWKSIMKRRDDMSVNLRGALEACARAGMPKQIYFDAAVFIQVALKAQWQDAILRRETIGPDGKLLMPPRFGEKIGYCPTFLMADEAQQSATPKDAEFKAVCRSKRASIRPTLWSDGVSAADRPACRV